MSTESLIIESQEIICDYPESDSELFLGVSGWSEVDPWQHNDSSYDSDGDFSSDYPPAPIRALATGDPSLDMNATGFTLVERSLDDSEEIYYEEVVIPSADEEYAKETERIYSIIKRQYECNDRKVELCTINVRRLNGEFRLAGMVRIGSILVEYEGYQPYSCLFPKLNIPY